MPCNASRLLLALLLGACMRELGAMFAETTAELVPPVAFDPDHYFSVQRHSWTSALVPDWNGDGKPDMFCMNHFGDFQSRLFTWMDFFMSPQDSGLYEEVLGDILTWVPDRDEDGELREHPYRIDAHGHALVDLDGDGFLDLYAVNGAGEQELGPGFDNFLMWGEESVEPGGLNRLVGGRAEANQAGLACNPCQGRHMYFFDADLDGDLDVGFMNMDWSYYNTLYDGPGHFFLNNGNRTFELDAEGDWSEFGRGAAFLTDTDGDRRARELVTMSNMCEMGLYDSCRFNTWGTYVWSAEESRMRRVSVARSQSGNVRDVKVTHLDNDDRPDVVVLSGAKLLFYLSSEQRQLDMSRATYIMSLENACVGSALQAADWDLDMDVELLVMCRQPGLHYMLKLNGDPRSSESWHVDSRGIGALAFPNLGGPVGDEELLGCTVVDLNHDGRLDLILAHRKGRGAILYNEYPTGENGYLRVKLVGQDANNPGVGAILVLKSWLQDRGDRKQVRVKSSTSHGHTSLYGVDELIHFGLGLDRPRRLVVFWARGAKTVITGQTLRRGWGVGGDGVDPILAHEPAYERLI